MFLCRLRNQLRAGSSRDPHCPSQKALHYMCLYIHSVCLVLTSPGLPDNLAPEFLTMQERKGCFISANPYNWPHDGSLTATNTALVIIDMQRDCRYHLIITPSHPILAYLHRYPPEA